MGTQKNLHKVQTGGTSPSTATSTSYVSLLVVVATTPSTRMAKIGARIRECNPRSTTNGSVGKSEANKKKRGVGVSKLAG